MSADPAGRAQPNANAPWILGALLVTSVLLELFFRYLRLPLFPVWVPLLLWGTRRLEMSTPAALLFAGSGIALLLGWWGSASLSFSLAVVVAVVAMRVSGTWWRGAAFILFATLAWLMLSAVAGSLPVGSFSFEVLFSAVFTQLTGQQWVAAVCSKLVILLLVLATLGLARLFWRLGPKVTRHAFLVLVLISGCDSTFDRTYFSPTAPDVDEGVVSLFAGTAELPEPNLGHVVLPAQSRTRELCASCHQDKVNGTSLPVAEKGIHEIHLVLQELGLLCTVCHEHAGEPGFPDLTAEGDRRNAYNQRCRICHMKGDEGGTAQLRWERRFR